MNVSWQEVKLWTVNFTARKVRYSELYQNSVDAQKTCGIKIHIHTGVSMNVTKAVQQVQQVMRRDPGLDGDAQRITQLSWLMFLKAVDLHEKEQSRRSSNYKTSIPSKLAWDSWTRKHNDLTGASLLAFVNRNLLPGLRELRGESALSELVRDIFASVQNHMHSGLLLEEVIAHVDALAGVHAKSSEHFIGTVYEKILSDLQNAGNAGEFYTPKALTDAIATLVAPKPKERVLDFACGTGGFLISCLNYLKNQHPKKTVETLSNSLLGVEKKAMPFLLCNTNLLLHGSAPNSGIMHGNLLTRELASFSESEKVDVIVTNPPFGAIEDESVQFNFPSELRSRDTADLFIILMMQLLKDGGRAAIVLPDGFLFAGGVKQRIRKHLLQACNLHTILRLPKGVFSPYTGIATNVLFLSKGTATESIRFYEHKTREGIKSYSKTKPIQDGDLAEFVRWFQTSEASDNSWSVSAAEIAKNDYRLDLKNAAAQGLPNKNPSVARKDLLRHGEALSSERTSLKNHLSSALKDRDVGASTTLLENLDVLCSSPAGISKLKRAILVLGIEGRLSPHLRGEPSVSEMLRAPRYSNRIDFGRLPQKLDWRKSIPQHWELLTLGDLGSLEGGGTPTSSDPDNFSDEGIPWLTPSDLYGLSSKTIGRGRRDLSEKGFKGCSAKLLPRGTVLFSSRAPIGYVAIAANDLCTNQGFKSCVPFIPEMTDYLYYFLIYERPWIEEAAPGTTFKEVSGRGMKSVVVPIPPIKEQQSIVSALEEAFRLLDRVSKALTNYQEAETDLLNNIERHIAYSS